jgi:hypothetical protein
MPIRFICKNCERRLFAQEQFEGCRAACPSCGQPLDIPIPLRPAAQIGDREDKSIVDMELGPDDALPVDLLTDATVTPGATGSLEETSSLIVKAALEKMIKAEQSVMISRAVAVIATTVTAGWMMYLGISAMFADEPPYAAIIFTGFLVYGLLSVSRQMLLGPASVHVAAATAIVMAMPLTLLMGLPVVSYEAVQNVIKENEARGQPMSLATAHMMILLNFSVIGLVFSLPVWVAAVKITLLRRMKRRIKEAANAQAR